MLILFISTFLMHAAISAANLQDLKKLQDGVSTWMQKRDRIPQETASNETDLDEEMEELNDVAIQETSTEAGASAAGFALGVNPQFLEQSIVKFPMTVKSPLKKPKQERKIRKRSSVSGKQKKFSEQPSTKAPVRETRKYVTKPVPKIAVKPLTPAEKNAPLAPLLEESVLATPVEEPLAFEEPKVIAGEDASPAALPTFPLEEPHPIKKIWVSKRPAAQLYFKNTTP